MSRRDEGMLNTYEDAKDWLSCYKHTIIDEQVVKVIELIENVTSEDWDDLQNQVSCKEDAIKECQTQNTELVNQIAELKTENEVLKSKLKQILDIVSAIDLSKLED